MSKKKVIIGLSGGVDSSVGVIELLKQDIIAVSAKEKKGIDDLLNKMSSLYKIDDDLEDITYSLVKISTSSSENSGKTAEIFWFLCFLSRSK